MIRTMSPCVAPAPPIVLMVPCSLYDTPLALLKHLISSSTAWINKSTGVLHCPCSKYAGSASQKHLGQNGEGSNQGIRKKVIASVVIAVSGAKNECRGTWALSGREQGERTELSTNRTVIEAYIGTRFVQNHIVLAWPQLAKS
jgi:hypothetical protein